MKKQIKNRFKTLMLLILTVTIALSFNATISAKAFEPRQATYQIVSEVCDWGATATKVIVNLGRAVKYGSISNDTFTVYVSRSDSRLKVPLVDEGYRKVVKAYISDKKGNPTRIGNYATLEMEIGPNIPLCSLINYDVDTYENALVDYKCTITQVKNIGFGPFKISGLVATKCTSETKKLVDDFSIGKSKEYNNITFPYAEYKPAKDRKKNPLIIWLHGGGETGTDALIPLSANKSVNLASKEIQSYFKGAYVLIPQGKTYWCEGKVLPFDGTSIYEEPLMAFIKDYVSQNKDIDTNRIYIGGCSAGGYMTMLMIRDYSDYFAAAFPICECLVNEAMYEGKLYTLVTDEDIQKLKNVPIWFVSSKNDPSVVTADCSTKTYERLMNAGAKNVYYSLYDDVHDTSGLYKNDDGSPYQYHGHFSWIYALNNECKSMINGKKTSIMEWLASMSLNKR